MARRRSHDEAAAVMRSAGLEPLEPYYGWGERWRCTCQVCGSEVSPSYGNVSHGTGFRVCADEGRSTRQRMSDAAASDRVRSSGLEPIETYPGSQVPWSCRCLTCGREVTPIPANLGRQGGCRYCGRVRQNDGRRVNADDAGAVMAAAGFEPLEPFPGANVGWLCRCSRCGGESRPRYLTVRHRGSGCRYCADNPVPPKVVPDVAVGVMLAAGLEPLERYVNALRPWRCRCTRCGNITTPRYSAVRRGIGCKFCAESGFDLLSPALVYVLTHAEWGAHKVGVTAPNSNRLEKFSRHDWETNRTLALPTGEDAYRVEQDVLEWLRADLGLRCLNSSGSKECGTTHWCRLRPTEALTTASSCGG